MISVMVAVWIEVIASVTVAVWVSITVMVSSMKRVLTQTLVYVVGWMMVLS